jgi:hypothetical protein
LHPNLCLSNHTKQQTWNKANILKKSFQNELSSMKIHDFQAKWPMLQLVWKDSFPKWSHILHMCVYYTSQQVCQRKFLFSLHEKSIFHFPSDKSRGFFVKDLPNIWCQLEPLYFCKILDHVLFKWSIFQMNCKFKLQFEFKLAKL